jgi:hypothetical protein
MPVTRPPQRTTGKIPALTPAPAARPPVAATQAGQAAAAFVGSLSKAARSFTLYDPSNAVVRGFLADYRAKAAAATAQGELALEVRPFQLLRGGEVVYQEEDRERSLSFRLFRDGLREITFTRGVAWEELLHFLEILAIRYTGVRQQEDDSVTLLRKAEFGGISFQAVEGFVPEEDNPEPVEKRKHVVEEASAPPTFDTPFPALPAPGPAELRSLPAATLGLLRADEHPDAFGHNALGAAELFLREAASGALTPGDARQFLVEARDYFIADGSVPDLAGLADLMARQPPSPLRDELLRSLGDARILELLLASLGDLRDLPPEAARLVPLVPAASVLDLLATEPSETRRAALLRIVEARLPAESEVVIERLAGFDAATAKGLARAVCARSPDRTVPVLLALLASADDGLKVSALEGLESAEGEVPSKRIVPLLRGRHEAVRIAAAHVLERRGEAEAFAPLQQALAGPTECSRDEADALGRALAMVHPARAAALFAEWLRPKKGFFRRAFTSRRLGGSLAWAAVSGLGALPGPEAAEQIEEVVKRAGDELKRHCAAVLARRRHEEQPHHG